MNELFDNYLFDAFANASDNIYVYVTDVETGMTKWSLQAVEYFNLEKEYLTNVKDIWPAYIHPEDRLVYQKDIEAVFSGRSANHHCQYRVRNRYGEYVWVECRGSIIYDNLGVPKVFAGIMTRLDNPNKYDSLTHLLTGYELFSYSLDSGGTLMMIGVDGMRDINSQHGVLYGNKVIRYLADVLSEYAPETTRFRYWGDDFVLYDRNISPQGMMGIFRRISGRCALIRDAEGIAGFSVSGGIVSNKAGLNQTELVERAELAMGYAKKQITHVAVYSDEIGQIQNRRLAVSEALMDSIHNQCRDFYLVYQPIMRNNASHVLGCEALLRWKPRNEAIGACYPDEFIPLLEESGGIIDVGYFVMREAIRQVALWQKKWPWMQVSVNVSYYQMEDPGFAAAVVAEMEKYHLDPASVVIELTESVLINDTDVVNRIFDYFKSHGVHVALDDFGCGNSSFWMLHNFKVDCVKLDQSFIRNLKEDGDGIDDAIIRSTLLLCQSIGCKSIAEGVENESVYQRIKDFGFSGIQGYLFAKPLLPEAMEGFMASRG